MKKRNSTQIVPGNVVWLRRMRNPGDRLRDLRIKKGYTTASDAARAFGWNENTYKSHENGERGIKLHVARRYAHAFGTDPGYILTGSLPGSLVQEVASIPLVGIVAAGAFRPSDWKPEEDVGIPAVVRKDIPAIKQYAVRVEGPSVNRKIPDGMYAICATFDSFPGGAPAGGLVHVVRERGDEVEHTIKELRVTSDGLLLCPVSDHPEHQEPIKYQSDEELTVRINGVVIGVFQPF